MFRSIELESVIMSVLFDDGWNERVLNGGQITDRDWTLIKNVVHVLGPFKSATVRLSKESACISEYIPTVTCILKTLRPGSSQEVGVVTLKRRLYDNLYNRTEYIESTEHFTLATLLDMRFKDKFFQDNLKRDEAKGLLIEKLENEYKKNENIDNTLDIIRIEETDANANVYEEYDDDPFTSMLRSASQLESNQSGETPASVVDDYLNSKLEKYNLDNWSKYAESNKNNVLKQFFVRLAKYYLTAPPTSTNVERLFSVMGNVIDSRYRLLPENAEKFLLMRENLKLKNFAIDW